jgi:hypothetical protein
VVTVAGLIKALGVDYTITGVDTINGGEISFVPAAVPGSGVLVELQRVLSYSRGTSYAQNGGFQPEIVDKDQDYQTAILQQISNGVRHAIKLPTNKTGDYVLQGALPNTLVGFDADGNLELKTASSSFTVQAGTGGYPSVTYVSASGGPVEFQLVAGEEVVIIKIDDTVNPVHILPPTGGSFADGSEYYLYNQFETFRFVSKGAVFYKVEGGQAVPFNAITVQPFPGYSGLIIGLDPFIQPDIYISPTATDVVVIKTDSSVTPVTVHFPDGSTYQLFTQAETAHFILSGSTYYKI